jgi:hypothetical protein
LPLVDISADCFKRESVKIECGSTFGALFEKPFSQHRRKLLILRGGICRSAGSEYIRIVNTSNSHLPLLRMCFETSLKSNYI